MAIQVVPQDVAVDSASCVIRLVETENQSRERVFSCGTWFQPPVGRYFFWAEQNGMVSAQTIIRYAGEPFRGSGLMLSKQMVPAGVLQLDRSIEVPRGSTFRLLSLELIGTHRPFDRRIERAHAYDTVRMPSGKVLGGIFDENGRALALARPQRVRGGAVTTLRPERPRASRSGVLAVLERATTPGAPPCDASLTIGQRQHRAAVDLQMHQRVVLAWYELPASSDARLDVRCAGATPFTRQLRLEPRAIATVRAAL
ncbi:MAG TPA: hypothetical protein VEK11_08485 [Thermoanaerobaculia bacterium]|nr:hypothetical protein [Thermoanaerobaculia bacterium]